MVLPRQFLSCLRAGALKLPMSQVLSNTSIKVFFGIKTWGGGGGGSPPNFFWW